MVASVARVNRRLAVARGCCARWSWHFRVGVAASVAVGGRVGGGRHEPVPRRAQASVEARGYRAMRWSNSKAGAHWSSGSAEGSCSVTSATGAARTAADARDLVFGRSYRLRFRAAIAASPFICRAATVYPPEAPSTKWK